MFSTFVSSKFTKLGFQFSRRYSSEYTKSFLLPSAKRLVALNGLDASNIVGTGLGGRIMRYDVVNYMESLKTKTKNPSKPAPRVPTPISNQTNNFVDEPLAVDQKSKVDNDNQLKTSIPHAYSMGDINLCKTNSYIKSIKQLAGEQITLTDIAIKSASLALMQQQSLSSVALNVCIGIAFGVSKTFTIENVQGKTLLDIHKAVEEGRQAPTTPLTGIATVCCLDDIVSAGGILSSPAELATFTLGSPYHSVCVDEDGQPKACSQARVNVAYNALKLNEVSSHELVATFSKFVENPEFLLE